MDCGSLLQKYLPIDLRTKKTRAIRRRLTPYQVRHCHSRKGIHAGSSRPWPRRITWVAYSELSC